MLAVPNENLHVHMTNALDGELSAPEGLDEARGPGDQRRRCAYPECTTKLSTYNPDRMCWMHGRTVAFARLDRAPLGGLRDGSRINGPAESPVQ